MIRYHALIRPSLSLSPYSYRAFAASPNKVVIPSDRRRRRVVRWPLPRSSAPRQRFADRTARRTPALLLSSRLPPLPPLILQIPFSLSPSSPFLRRRFPLHLFPRATIGRRPGRDRKDAPCPFFLPSFLFQAGTVPVSPFSLFSPLHFYIIFVNARECSSSGEPTVVDFSWSSRCPTSFPQIPSGDGFVRAMASVRLKNTRFRSVRSGRWIGDPVNELGQR